MKETDSEELGHALLAMLSRQEAITDVIAVICQALRKQNPQDAEAIATMLQGMSEIPGATTSEQMSNLVAHLVPHLLGDLDAQFLSLTKGPPLRDREALRSLMRVVPKG